MAGSTVKRSALLVLLCWLFYPHDAYATGSGLEGIFIAIPVIAVLSILPTLVVVYRCSGGDAKARKRRTLKWTAGMVLFLPVQFVIIAFASGIATISSYHSRSDWGDLFGVLCAAALPALIAYRVYNKKPPPAVPPDLARLRKKAEEGDPMAQDELGFLYYVGRDVPQDFGEAYFWYALSALVFRRSGSADIAAMQEQKAAQIKPALKDDTIAAQDARIAAWMPRGASE